MAEPFRFEVLGEPVAKQRVRLGSRGNTYTPEKTINAQQLIGWQYKRSRGTKFEGPVRLTLEFVLGSRRSPDVDNLAKTVMDALNGVAYSDDRQVTALSATKRIGAEPRTIIEISEAK